MNDDDEMRVFVPRCEDDDVSELLRNLTKMIVERHRDKHIQGFLGGEFGYGCDYETPAFRMFPYYWGDCVCGYEQLAEEWSEQNKHAPACYQTAYGRISEKYDWLDDHPAYMAALEAECAKRGIPWEDGKGCACHCDCGHQQAWEAWAKDHDDHKPECPVVIPNFLHKSSGATVRWYKYIGRGMEVDAPAGFDWETAMRECAESLGFPEIGSDDLAPKPPRHE